MEAGRDQTQPTEVVHAVTGSGRSKRWPRSKRAPALTRATRWGAFMARHRCLADSISLKTMARAAVREPAPRVTLLRSRGLLRCGLRGPRHGVEDLAEAEVGEGGGDVVGAAGAGLRISTSGGPSRLSGRGSAGRDCGVRGNSSAGRPPGAAPGGTRVRRSGPPPRLAWRPSSERGPGARPARRAGAISSSRQRRTVDSDTLLPSALSAERWSWRSTARTITAIRPGGRIRHRTVPPSDGDVADRRGQARRSPRRTLWLSSHFFNSRWRHLGYVTPHRPRRGWVVSGLPSRCLLKPLRKRRGTAGGIGEEP